MLFTRTDEAHAVLFHPLLRRALATTALIKENPAGVSRRSKRGNTPLHEAAKYQVWSAELLMDMYPAALHQRNAKGERPLDRARAASGGPPTEFVALLQDATNAAGSLL